MPPSLKVVNREVGFFWVVTDPDGKKALFSQRCSTIMATFDRTGRRLRRHRLRNCQIQTQDDS